MGTITPTLKRTLGLSPERSMPETQTLRKERSDMDNLTTTLQARETCSSAQVLHVYRHVDLANLQSEAPHRAKPLNLGGARLHGCFSIEPVHHAKQAQIAEQQFGGVL